MRTESGPRPTLRKKDRTANDDNRRRHRRRWQCHGGDNDDDDVADRVEAVDSDDGDGRQFKERTECYKGREE